MTYTSSFNSKEILSVGKWQQDNLLLFIYSSFMELLLKNNTFALSKKKKKMYTIVSFHKYQGVTDDNMVSSLIGSQLFLS